MAGRKVGTVVYKHDLSPTLSIFRLMPERDTGLSNPASMADVTSTASRVNITFEMDEW